jgi:hypothetical protein
MRLLLPSSSPSVSSRHFFLFSQWRQNLIVRLSCRPSTKQSYGAFEEMKKGTSAIYGCHVFFYQKGHGAAPSYFSLDKTLVNKHVTLYQLYLISKGDNIKSYLSFNRKDFLEINQSETRIACGGHV